MKSNATTQSIEGPNKFMETDSNTESNIVWSALIEEPAIIADCYVKIRSQGALFVCHRCEDVNSGVAAILVMSEEQDKCYALCRSCVRDLPEEIDP
jgi:hypothetical protein